MKKLMLLAILIPSICFSQNEQYPGSPPLDVLTFMVDSENKTCYYQDVVILDSSYSKSRLYEKSKQFIASAVFSSRIQLNYDNLNEGKLIFTTAEGLYIKQGIGTLPFTVKYTFTIELKDGRYRYTIDNIEVEYATLMTGAGKRELIYPEWLKSGKGSLYNNNYKRLVSVQNHIYTLINNLNGTVKSTIKSKSDF